MCVCVCVFNLNTERECERYLCVEFTRLHLFESGSSLNDHSRINNLLAR
jgi:hypothetical protein